MRAPASQRPPAAGFGSSWRELARRGLATPLEAQQIERNEAVLSVIRARLHALARRREDRLVFDLQTAVAESFGYRTRTGPDGRLVQRASEFTDIASRKDPTQAMLLAQSRGIDGANV